MEQRDRSRRVRVMIADDNKEMRETVIRLLENEYEIVGAVGDGRSLVAEANKLAPDIGIVDISMPIMNGIDAAAQIKKDGLATKIICLTVNEDTDFVRAAFEIGASGYVVKRQMASDLEVALTAVLAGRKFISPGCGLPALASLRD